MKKIFLFIGLFTFCSIAYTQNPTSVNPNNSGANISLSWLNDVSRLRVGGSNPGAGNGIDFQGPGDQSFLRLYGNGNVGIGMPDAEAKLGVLGLIKAGRSAATYASGVYMQEVIDDANSYSRAIFSFNTYWDFDNNLWKVKQMGANDVAAMLVQNNSGISFVIHPSTGNFGRQFTHSEFLSGTRMTITNAGLVGIGTTAPNDKLDVNGGIRFSSKIYKTAGSPGGSDPILISAHSEWGSVSGGGELPIVTLGYEQGAIGGTDMDTKIWSYARNLSESRNFITIGRNRIDLSAQKIYTDAKVGIGISNPSNKLDVAGTIRAEEVKVETGWADYVFAEDYNLRSLSEVSDYINENHHLPGIPTAKEVSENGIKLGEMNAKLLEKIEELTLYVIDLKKENEHQNQIIEKLLKQQKE